MTTDIKPMIASNDLLGDDAALRERFDEDGFLYFKKVVPHKALRKLRRDMTTILAEEGWIEGGKLQDRAIAIGKLHREGDEGYFRAHDRLIKLESLYSLAQEKRLTNIMKSILGKTAFPHPLSIMRLVFPNHDEASTPPHQDFPNNQGSKLLTAAWIPLSNCPRTMGPLKVMKGSHKRGVMPLKFHLGPGNRQADIENGLEGLDWYSADYELGDVLIFSAFTVHSAMDNRHITSMRLSVDFRFQPENEPLTEICLKPHFERLSWEDIYADWDSDRHKYYWKDKNYIVEDFDFGAHKLSPEKEKEAMAMAMKYEISKGDINPETFDNLRRSINQ